jgi:predicted RND superfamily exporter protein
MDYAPVVPGPSDQFERGCLGGFYGAVRNRNGRRSCLDGAFAGRSAGTRKEVSRAIIEAAQRRLRPCLMTTATTILVLILVLTSTGRGSDIMIPMAIPIVGGITLEVVTMLVVPVLYCANRESKLEKKPVPEALTTSGRRSIVDLMHRPASAFIHLCKKAPMMPMDMVSDSMHAH